MTGLHATTSNGPHTCRHHCVTAVYINMYYTSSLLLIVFNKWLFQYFGFGFPLMVTTSHFAVISVTLWIFLSLRGRRPKLSWNTYLKRVVPLGFSVGADIGMSNVTYLFLEVHFMEMVKSSTPIWVLLIAFATGTEKPSWPLTVVMLLVAFGLGIATYGEAEFDIIGFVMCTLAAILVGCRLVLMQMLLQSQEDPLDSLQLLALMAPLCALLLAPVAWVYEIPKYNESKYGAGGPECTQAWMLVLAGATLALLLNFSEFLMVNRTSALTFNIAGVLKVLVVVGVSAFVFHAEVSSLNLLGFGIALVGVSLFNYLKLVKLGVINGPSWAQPPGLHDGHGGSAALLPTSSGSDDGEDIEMAELDALLGDDEDEDPEHQISSAEDVSEPPQSTHHRSPQLTGR